MRTPGVTGGVDTHGQTHHAAVLDQLGRQLGDPEFPTTPGGYRALLAWMAGHGRLEHLRGSALGFRNLTDYIARSLLECGGSRPQLHRQL